MNQITTTSSGGHADKNALAMVADTKSVIAQVKAIQDIMRAVMKDGTHFGVIPGCKLPSLYKPGSEALLSAFKISVEPEVKEIRDGNHITYQIRCFGKHMASQILIGVGVGEASTEEDKYAWRAAVCQEEFDATPEDKRRVKWQKTPKWDLDKGFPPFSSVQQVRTNPADLANTVLKMAKKRAQIDLCLTGLAASDIFTQDVEDLPEEYLDGQAPPTKQNNRYQPQQRAQGQQQTASGAATEGQVRMMRAKLIAASKPEADLLAAFAVESLEAMPKSKVNEAIDWIAGKVAPQ